MDVQDQVKLRVPYFRPTITESEIEEVSACLRSGWLTTGPKTREFETTFAEQVGAKHAVAVNSCTAALHLAVESLGLSAGQAVLVPTLTFASTAEVVRYQGAVPILVDCDPVTLNMDLSDAERKVEELRNGELGVQQCLEVVGMIPVHVGGYMMDLDAVHSFAARHGIWVLEDAAHALPAAYRSSTTDRWQRCGDDTAAVTCFSFYSNKTMTTGEGGMAVTADANLADRMRQMSLHGLSNDAWNRYKDRASWDYRIIAPGFKYNLTDIAACLGAVQLQRVEDMRCQRERIADFYREQLKDLDQIELPPPAHNRIHSWHLFPIRLCLDQLAIGRDEFIQKLQERGVGCSVHWRPLHLHPYYDEFFGWRAGHLPAATAVWQRLISLPVFPSMVEEEQDHVVQVVRELCHRYAVGDQQRTNGRTKPR